MSVDFINRLKQLLKYFELSPSLFADQIGVPRSSMSHLLSGRNKPSLDFVLKVIKKFPEVNLYWLLNGKGSFPTIQEEQALTSQEKDLTSKKTTNKQIERVVVFYKDGTFESYSHSE